MCTSSVKAINSNSTSIVSVCMYNGCARVMCMCHVCTCVYVFVIVYMCVLTGKEAADAQEAIQKLQEHNAGMET